MPEHEAEAIVLRSWSLGEADRLVSFLSRATGRQRGVAKGAKRTKSRFGSTLETLSHVKIWTFERETRDLSRITQCELIESFMELQGEYETGVAASLVAEVSEVVLPEREASDAAFRLVLVTARAMKATRRVGMPVAYFAVWTLRLAGWLPGMERCMKCGKELREGAAFGSSVSPGLLCGNCKSGVTRVMGPGERLIARRILVEKLEALAVEEGLEEGAKAVGEWALDVIEMQAERKLKTRAMMNFQG